jgi:hypothetical protein
MTQGSMTLELERGLRIGERAWAHATLPIEIVAFKMRRIEIVDVPNEWMVHAISVHGAPAKFLQGRPLSGLILRDLLDAHVDAYSLQTRMVLAILVEYVGPNWHQREAHAGAIDPPTWIGAELHEAAGLHRFTCKVIGDVAMRGSV